MNCNQQKGNILSGEIFEIERFAIHDGRGIRTVVFFRGCPLRCLWCANPESQQKKHQIMFWKSRCIGCGTCIRECPTKSLSLCNGSIYRSNSCIYCGNCVQVCTSMAQTWIGKIETVDTVFQEILRDKEFYHHTGGGVTFSGGEALAQSDFVIALAERCRLEGIHTAVETSGYVPETVIEAVIPLIDEFLFDFKCMDSEKHKTLTGVGNKRILRNFEKIIEAKAKVVVRFPLIGGYNDDDENVHQLADYLFQHFPECKIDLLPYHSLGVSKYERLQMEYCAKMAYTPTSERVQTIREYLEKRGFHITIGG